MWDRIIATLDNIGIIEFAIHQMERKEDCQMWRKHNNQRFDNLHNALFSNKGAYAATTGTSPYLKNYSVMGRVIVPYVSTWDHESELAFLVRASASYPEITLVRSQEIQSINSTDDAGLLSALATLFGQGTQHHGVRWLTNSEIVVPTNDC